MAFCGGGIIEGNPFYKDFLAVSKVGIITERHYIEGALHFHLSKLFLALLMNIAIPIITNSRVNRNVMLSL
jgi:hypothetical protein